MHALLSPATVAAPLALSYARISSERQSEGDGIRRQIALSEEYAKEHGLNLDLSFRDLGVSAYDGSNRDRGALAALLAAIRKGDIPRGSYLLVESLDRLSRDHVTEALTVFLEIVRAGVVIVTLVDKQVYRHPIEPMQLLVSIMYMVRANDESKTKAFRLTKAWHKKRADAGRVKLTGRAPSWLRLDREKNEFVIDEERKKIVERIFRELADGIGRDRIAMRLNQDGIKAWGKPIGGKDKPSIWHGGSVQKITDSKAVVGWFQPHRLEKKDGKVLRVPTGDPIPNYFPCIIEEDLYLRARQAAQTRKAKGVANTGGRRGTIYSNLFSGFTRCGHCQSRMNYRDRGPRSTPVLICGNSRSRACDNRARYPYAPLEEAILRWVVDPSSRPEPDEEVRSLEREIAAQTIRREELVTQGDRLAAELDGTNMFVMRRLDALQAGITGIDETITRLQESITVVRGNMLPGEVRNTVERMRAQLDACQTNEQRYAIRAKVAQSVREIVKQIECFEDGKVVVEPHGHPNLLHIVDTKPSCR